MSKHHQHKASSVNRGNTSISIDPESRGQIQEATSFGQELTPTFEDVQRKAYQIHEQKGGTDFENWLEAEQILKEEKQKRW